VVDNDTLWFSALRNFSLRYKKQIINTATVIRYFSEATRMNLKPFFTQYLYKAGLPVLEYELKHTEDGRMEIKYRWSNIVKGFEMPIRATLTKDLFETITPMRAWQVIEPNYILSDDFKIQTDYFLIDVLKR
jgi:hypothetical protein